MPFPKVEKTFNLRLVSLIRRKVLDLVHIASDLASRALGWHRRPNRSGSPNRRHFDDRSILQNADFSHRRPTSQDFCRRFFWCFCVISDQANVFSHR